MSIGLPSHPDIEVASELYCLCLNLMRLHPDDLDLLEDVDTAWALLVDAYERHNGRMGCLRTIQLESGGVTLVLEPEMYARYGYGVSDKRLEA